LKWYVVNELPILSAAITNQILAQVRDLADSLLSEANEILQTQKLDPVTAHRASLLRTSSSVSSSVSRICHIDVPPKLQKAKIEEAMRMVERETAVINAVLMRLERLS
jgi:nucleoporin NUP82